MQAVETMGTGHLTRTLYRQRSEVTTFRGAPPALKYARLATNAESRFKVERIACFVEFAAGRNSLPFASVDVFPALEDSPSGIVDIPEGRA